MTEDDDTQRLARIDVKRGAPSSSTPRMAMPKVLSVTRVTLPSFEVVYREVEGALVDAQQISVANTFELERELGEPAGTEVVLEFAVGEVPFSVTLLFRVVSSSAQATVLEWWARRATDARLLELWIEALTPLRGESPPEVGFTQVNAAEVQHAMELYRRTLASNPFDVLGLHWTANGVLAAEACAAIVAEIDGRVAAGRGGDQAARYLAPSRDRIIEAAHALAGLENRVAIRSRVVPRKELEMARRQAEYLLALAERDCNPEGARRAQEMLAEVGLAASR